MFSAKRSMPIATTLAARSPRQTVVIAGPSSTVTIPGIVVSQIVDTMAISNPVIRINVDDRTDFDSGLFRAPSLASALRGDSKLMRVHQAPTSPRARDDAFVDWVPHDALAAVAFVWPGIESSWVSSFIAAANAVGARTSVICASVPKSTPGGLESLAELVAGADVVLVGDKTQARMLSGGIGEIGPAVHSHPALRMDRPSQIPKIFEIIAFLPRDNTGALATLLTAFDAIPEAWIDRYRLDVFMRHNDATVPEIIDASYHSEFVTLVSDDLTSDDLQKMVASSSALLIADPVIDSRAFSMAMECGLPIVVVTSTELPEVGRGYVGAFLADATRPASVYVALTHTLRLAELKFPRPDEWRDLVEDLVEARSLRDTSGPPVESTLLR